VFVHLFVVLVAKGKKYKHIAFLLKK